jgi:hypothetical protein
MYGFERKDLGYSTKVREEVVASRRDTFDPVWGSTYNGANGASLTICIARLKVRNETVNSTKGD